MAFLEIKDVSKIFGKQTYAVKDFNLELEKGELVSFLGPSGCGKTTTLRVVAGFEPPTFGEVWIQGKNITSLSPNQRNIGMVFQAYALFPNMTVAQNIGYGLKIAKKTHDEIEARVQEMLDLIHMPEFSPRYPHQLSGGQQQRVALARALALRPAVLLLDEPLSALDAKIRVSLRSEIRSIQQTLKITSIYVTHDQEEALSLSDRVVVMNRGHIEQVGTPFEIYNFPQTEFVAEFVGTLNTIDVEVKDGKHGVLGFNGSLLHTTQELDHISDGLRVKIAVRPEAVSLAQIAPKTNVLDAVVRGINFLGSIVRIQVDLGNQNFYLDTFNNPNLALPKIGEKTQVTFSEDSVLVLNNNKAK